VRSNASTVDVQDPTQIIATSTVPAVPGQPLDLFVRMPDGRSARLSNAVLVSPQDVNSPQACTFNVPTDDAAGYKTFDLYSDRTAAVNVTDHQTFTQYPSSLNSNNLLVTRTPVATDTVGLFNSEPYDYISLEANGTHPQSYVDYTVSPPRYATSIGSLAMGYLIFNGTGAFNDGGKALLRATVTYANGDTNIRMLHVGYHLREYFNSGYSCNFVNIPMYVARPSDPLSGYVYEDNTNGYYYDVQEQLLSASKRNKKVTSVRLEAVLQDHFCTSFVPHTYAGEHLHGLSLWSKFSIRNRLNQAVALQTQTATPAADSLYGGYVFNNAYVGYEGDMGAKGCFVACLSMAHNYFGVTCTPQALNHWLQANRGYSRQPRIRITSIGGQTVGSTVQFSKIGDAPAVGSFVTVEQGLYNPIDRIQITGATSGQIVVRHQTSGIAMNDVGYIYEHPAHYPATAGFSNSQWQLQPLWGGATTPSDIEDALSDSLPVLVHTRLDANCHGRHWVLADGREPAVTSATEAHGTYRVKDPAYGATRLIESPHVNRFTDARVCRRIKLSPEPQFAAGGEAVVAAASDGLQLFFDGPGVIEITDPQGRTITYDGGADDYVSGIPGALVSRRWIVEDVDNGALDTDPVDVIEIPGAVGGGYIVKVTGQGTGDFVVQANVYSATGTTSTDFQTATTASGNIDYYRVTYTQQSASVTVVTTDVTPPGGTRAEFGLSLSPNPGVGPVQVSYGVDTPGRVKLGVYDAQGREVVSLISGVSEAGAHTLQWDGRNAAGGQLRAGVYFVRLALGDRVATRRLVLAR
jgi:flagellar hook capping protein FlgD